MWSHIWNRELAEESLCMYSWDCQAWGWLTRMVTPFTTTTLFVDYLHWCITALQSIFEYACELQPGRYLGPLYDVRYFYCVQRKYLKKIYISNVYHYVVASPPKAAQPKSFLLEQISQGGNADVQHTFVLTLTMTSIKQCAFCWL